MDQALIAKAADALHNAERSRVPIPPLTEQYPEMSIADAYAIQLRNVERAQSDGGRVAGHKVGLTSQAMQQALGVDQPDYGHLFTGMFHLETMPIDSATFVSPRVEPEIAFVLASSLKGPGLTVADAMRAVDFVLPALEIIDSRIKDWRIRLEDTIADNASSGGVVLGGHASRLGEHDLRLAMCSLSHNGRVTATGAGSAVLGSPLNALVWLANKLGETGTQLEAGHVVLPGSCTAAVPVSPSDAVTADFGPLGSVTAVF